MVTAFALIDVNRDMVPETAEALTGIDGVAEVYSVAGEWDLIAVVRVHTNEELAEVVTEHMLRLEGIENTETLIAFRAYSSYDLERMFSIGMDETISGE